ncbi:hypothetical protein [Algiphilus sp.]|uniref:hypothetical protein n=1 Tax=Algiphilus sp. TaxID=1872431 RepID=UPI003CCBAFE4
MTTSTTAAADDSETLTIEKMRAVCDQLKQIRHPIEQWLIEQGGHPDTHFVALSVSRKHERAWWPRCVTFTHLVGRDQAIVAVLPEDIASGTPTARLAQGGGR